MISPTSGWPIYIYWAVPILATILFARNMLWRSLREVGDRFLARQQRSIDELIVGSDVRPILYLRAIKDDNLTVGNGVRLLDLLMGAPRIRPRFEELIANQGFGWRPMVALGNPHIPLNLSGVLKKTVSNETWKEEVVYWHEKSAYTVMIANTTDNIAWEIDLIQKSRRANSVIFIVTSVKRARNFFTHYNVLGESSPPIDGNTLVVYHDPDFGWVALTSLLRTKTAYATAIDIAFSRMEGGLPTADSPPSVTMLAAAKQF